MEKTTTVELTEAEIRMLVDALEGRIEHLMDWGAQANVWKNPAERELVLNPLERLTRVLMNA